MRILFLSIIAALSMLCAGDALAASVVTLHDDTYLYSDPECTVVADNGIARGVPFECLSEENNGAYLVAFAGEKVYIKSSDVSYDGTTTANTATDDGGEPEPEPDGPDIEPIDGAYDNMLDEAIGDHSYSSGGFKFQPWMAWLILIASVFLLYKFTQTKLFGKILRWFFGDTTNQYSSDHQAQEETTPVVPKYGPHSPGFVAGFNSVSSFRKGLEKLNRLAAKNPGADTTDSEALCEYLMLLQPALKYFLSEASAERSTYSQIQPHPSLINADNEGGAEWLYIQLRTYEYIPVEQLRQLDPLKYEMYITRNLNSCTRNPQDVEVVKRRLYNSLYHYQDYDLHDQQRMCEMLGKILREKEPQKAYEYFCYSASIGGSQGPKAAMEREYGVTPDGKLNMSAYRRKKIIKWVIVGIIGAAVVAVLIAVALYLMLMAFFALVIFTTIKVIWNDSTGGDWSTSGISSKSSVNISSSSCGSGCSNCRNRGWNLVCNIYGTDTPSGNCPHFDQAR